MLKTVLQSLLRICLKAPGGRIVAHFVFKVICTLARFLPKVAT
jgi:ribosomal protein L34E